MSMPRPRAARIAALALAAALTVTACSSDDAETAPPPTEQTTQDDTTDGDGVADDTAAESDNGAEDSTDEPDDPATAETDDPAEAESAAEAGVDPVELGDPVATFEVGAHDIADPDAAMVAEVYPLQREGDVVTLVMRWTLRAEPTERGVFRGLLGEASGLGAVTLVDPVNLRQHSVVEAGGSRLMSGSLTFYQGGQSRYWSAVFAAPPEDVTAMTLLFPVLPAIPDVPIR